MKKFVLLLGAAMLLAQTAPVTRTVVTRADVSAPGREAVVTRVDLAPNAQSGRHTHPGEEISYVLDGEIELTVDGQPPYVRKAGEGFIIPNGAIHNARAMNGAVHLSTVYLIEKGKPLATPVAQ
jgi:quercetin dioxygenase-like cupin family protein